MKRKLLFSILGVALFGCGASNLQQTARHEDLPALQRAIQDAQKRGELDRGAVRDLAEAVVERELGSATGDVAVARVRDVRSCAVQAEEPLSRVAEREDAAGGAATLALLEAGRLSHDELVVKYANAKEPAWRAVAARSAVGPERTETRQRLLLDPDLRVRRAAAHAALSAPSEADLPALFEAARLDPDPLVRSLSVQALGALGGEAAVERLFELWPRSDAETRLGIVDAWARAESYRSGGHARLLWVLDSEQGLPALVAARGVLQHESPEAPRAESVLVRAMRSGSSDEQRLSIRLAPLRGSSLEATRDLAKKEDPEVQVMAAARLLESKPDRESALGTLKKLAAQSAPRVQRQARSALAVAGDHSVVPSLQADLSADSPAVRRSAALGLLALGEHARAATSLGDPAASVRTQVACAILTRL